VLPRPAADYTYLGMTHIALQQVQVGTRVNSPAADSPGALENLRWYLDALVNLGLSTTNTAAWNLRAVAERLAALPSESILTEEDAKTIRDATLMLRETLKAETSNLTLYEVSGKRFDTKALLTNVPSLMRTGTYGDLPLLAAIDLHESATCIAFDRPTAAAFHALRATEKVLRHYYTCVVRQNRLRKPWLWNPMLEQLRKPRRTRKPNRAVLDHLDSIRHNFRNPTQHPEKIYDIEEAQNLFGQCVSVIEAMIFDDPWSTPDDAVSLAVPAS
jgi:hypothetical protein